MLRARIVYDSLRTEFGLLWLAATERGLCRIGFDQPEETFVNDLTESCAVMPVRDPAALAEARRQLSQYLAGQREAFSLELDLDDLTGFQRDALAACVAVPYGKLATYAALAHQVGRPRAARAIGSAMAHNPIPFVIPCHRVVRSDGGLGGYGGGLSIKERLLALEGARS
jgi:methylated-DNA-[protein]-cysteine S-methyltransferase